MANNKLLVNERQADLGQVMVGRLLPFRKKRQVGPFTFIDHMGPATLGNGHYMDVDQHPHIGLSTLTYLFEGHIEHRDSTGSVQIIGPGDVGFMTAGSGVTHTERTPTAQRTGQPFTVHGYQIWVALHKDRAEMAPRFDFIPSAALPTWQDGPLYFRLAAGSGFGRTAPLQGYSPLFMVDIHSSAAPPLELQGQLQGEVAFVIVRGAIVDGDQRVEAGQMLISKVDEQCAIGLEQDAQILLVGGAPLPEPRFLSWNFVSHNKERLQQAKDDWEQHRFPQVPNDDTYIPFPSRKPPR